MKSRRSTRKEACRLAVDALGCFDDEFNAARLMSLCVFFETYIGAGADQTEKTMHLLSRRKTKKFKVIAGGNLA